MEKLSEKLERLSNQLDELSFVGLDQNPKGIRDELYALIVDAKALERQVT